MCIRDRVDYIRIDHFRGFEAYWAVPAGEKTAMNGKWKKGPGEALFEAIQKALGEELPIFAEDLGIITPEVEKPVSYTHLKPEVYPHRQSIRVGTFIKQGPPG